MREKDVKFLAGEYHIHQSTVKRFLATGIDEDEVPELCDIYTSLTHYRSERDPDVVKLPVVRPTIRHFIKVFEMLSLDLENMEQVADEARTLIKGKNNSYVITSRELDACLYEAARIHLRIAPD